MTRFPDYIHPNGQPWIATPRSGSQSGGGITHAGMRLLENADATERRAGASQSWKLGGAPYRQAHPMFAHRVTPEPARRSRLAALLAWLGRVS